MYIVYCIRCILYTSIHVTVTSSCGQSKFTCDNKNCVPASSECNFVDDCGDSSDEAICRKYRDCHKDRECRSFRIS